MDDGHGDVIPEHPHVVLGQREHLGEAVVIYSIRGATQGQADQMGGRVGILIEQERKKEKVYFIAFNNNRTEVTDFGSYKGDWKVSESVRILFLPILEEIVKCPNRKVSALESFQIL